MNSFNILKTHAVSKFHVFQGFRASDPRTNIFRKFKQSFTTAACGPPIWYVWSRATYNAYKSQKWLLFSLDKQNTAFATFDAPSAVRETVFLQKVSIKANFWVWDPCLRESTQQMPCSLGFTWRKQVFSARKMKKIISLKEKNEIKFFYSVFFKADLYCLQSQRVS